MTTRRNFLRTCAAATAAGMPFLNRGRFSLWQGGAKYSAVFDMLSNPTEVSVTRR